VWRKILVGAIVTTAMLWVVAWLGLITGDSWSSSIQYSSQNHFFWYLSRTSALLAYIVLFINIVFGLGMKTGFLDKLAARWRSLDLHQFFTLLAMGLVTLHIFSLLGDSYMNPALADLLIPGSGSYRPFWTALGILSFYSLIIITLSSFLRRFIHRSIWRVIHFVSFILFYVILYHGLGSGTDSSALWVKILYLVSGTSVACLALWRFLLARRPEHSSPVATHKID
jgi:predicted ferric reductase